MLRILLINDTPKKVGRLKSALVEAGFEVIDESGLTIDLPERVEAVRAHLGGCRFYNCMHRHEPGCEVIAALARGQIAAQRYRHYGEILDELRGVEHA